MAEYRVRRPLPVPDSAFRGPEGVVVLEEMPTALGDLLWRSLRTVRLWSRVVPAERADLFLQGAQERRLSDVLCMEMPAALRAPLEVLTGVLGQPETIDPRRIGAACTRVAVWAESAAQPKVALEFREAAALSCPYDAQFALDVGRAARDLAQYERAEAWLQRCIAIARQLPSWEVYVRAHIAMGKMLARRGSFPRARNYLQRALRRSERAASLRPVQAMALHDLFGIEFECGNFAEAHRYAVSAAECYAADDSNLVAFAHDVACFWMEQGYFAAALPVFRSVLRRVAPHHRPNVYGSIGRAAGSVGDTAEFDGARDALRASADAPGLAVACIALAQGALSLRRWEEARELAARAVELGRSRHEHKVVLMAESLADQAVRKQALQNQVFASLGEQERATADQLSESLVAQLERGLVAA
jgi:tetratricopeptide (TPR) repeat protein